jgi:OmcA/MtrC family decaheme c-type cytochrome
VTDPTAVPRRKDVTLTQCNQCHQGLSAHGGTRQNTEYCVICHSTNTMLNVTVPIDGGVVTAGSVNFKRFIHELHAAAQYPSPLNNCQKCHTATGYALPLPAGEGLSRSENRVCGPNGAPADGGLTCLAASVIATPVFEAPTTAACTSCHDSLPSQVHAALNTTASGQEDCAVCHMAGRSEGIDSVHALTP